MSNPARRLAPVLALSAPIVQACADDGWLSLTPATCVEFTVANLGTSGMNGLHGENLFAFEVIEASAGADLNGDGDSSDRFYRAWDLRSGSLTNLDVMDLGVPGGQELFVCGRSAAFRSFEDGELYLFEADTGLVEGLGVEGAVQAFTGDVLYFTMDEGVGDLNGDGDLLDSVLHALVLPSRAPLNLGLAIGFAGVVLAEGETLVVGVWEAGQGNQDLNGDGDDLDSVAHLFVGPLQPPTNLGLVIRGPDILGHEEYYLSPFLERDALVFAVAEGSQGSTDLDGDGDVFDNVLHVVDVPSGVVENLGLDVADLQVQEGLVVISVAEGGVDTNDDGDATDTTLFVHEPGTGPVRDLGMAVAGVSIAGRSVLFTVPEEQQALTDLNGDGDASDLVLHIFDASTGILTSTGFAVEQEGHRLGDSLYFFVSEAAQGALDLDGDGDSDDFVLHRFELGTGVVTNFRLRGFAIADRNRLALQLDETTRDTNGDGDVVDPVWHALGEGCSAPISLGLSGMSVGSNWFPLGFSGGLLVLSVSESAQGGMDLNGDGDALDAILHVVDLDPD